MENKNIREAKKLFDELQEDEEENAKAEARLLYIREINSATSSGYDSGVKDGIKQGIEQGTEAGEKKKSIEIAKKLLENGIDIQIIINSTGLTKEEIESLKKP